MDWGVFLVIPILILGVLGAFKLISMDYFWLSFGIILIISGLRGLHAKKAVLAGRYLSYYPIIFHREAAVFINILYIIIGLAIAISLLSPILSSGLLPY